MLRWRLLLGTVFISALVGLVWADVHYRLDGFVLHSIAGILTVLATQEYLGLVGTREPKLDRPVLYIGNLSIVVLPWLALNEIFPLHIGKEDFGDVIIAAYTIAMLTVVIVEIGRYDKDKSERVTERLAFTAFGLFYVGVLMSFIMRLCYDGRIYPLVSMLVVVKMADIGAYTVGRLIGKHKLAPKLSPGKTIEGLCGGLVFSVLGGLLIARLFGREVFGGVDEVGQSILSHTIVYALVVGVTGVVGDLVESLLKRDFGRKDSSTWMPGFGGVLDILDSPLLAAPVAWAFWHWGWMR